MENAARAYLRLCLNAPSFGTENSLVQQQRDMATRIANLIETEPNCHHRTCMPAHMTASAFVVDYHFRAAVLMFHQKLQRWMQPGGHADGETSMHSVALKEAQEETGLTGLTFFPLTQHDTRPNFPLPFDVDIHEIPAWNNVPAHWHYDVRYAFRAPKNAILCANHESNGLEWVPFANVAQYTQEDSVLRMFKKLENFVLKKV